MMGYDEARVREIEKKMNEIYDSVESDLKKGIFIPGPGVTANISQVPPTQGESVFGGPDPYLKGMANDLSKYLILPYNSTRRSNETGNGTPNTRLFEVGNNPEDQRPDTDYASEASSRESVPFTILIGSLIFFLF